MGKQTRAPPDASTAYTAEQFAANTAMAATSVKDLLLRSPSFVNDTPLGLPLKKEIMRQMNEIPTWSRRTNQAILEIRKEQKVCASRAEDAERRVIKLKKEVERGREQITALLMELEKRRSGGNDVERDLIDIFGSPTPMGSDHGVDIPTPVVIDTVGNKHEESPYPEVSYGGGSNRGWKAGDEPDVGSGVEEDMDRGAAASLADTIRNHNDSARLQNSHLPSPSSHLAPLWDHVTAKPMQAVTQADAGSSQALAFPLIVEDSWGLREDVIDLLVKRLRVPNIEDWSSWHVQRKRVELLKFCGVQGRGTYDAWHQDEVEQW